MTMTTHIGRRIDPLNHFTKPEWRSMLRRARITEPKTRDRSEYSAPEFLAILTAAEANSNGR